MDIKTFKATLFIMGVGTYPIKEDYGFHAFVRKPLFIRIFVGVDIYGIKLPEGITDLSVGSGKDHVFKQEITFQAAINYISERVNDLP